MAVLTEPKATCQDSTGQVHYGTVPAAEEPSRGQGVREGRVLSSGHWAQAGHKQGTGHRAPTRNVGYSGLLGSYKGGSTGAWAWLGQDANGRALIRLILIYEKYFRM